VPQPGQQQQQQSDPNQALSSSGQNDAATAIQQFTEVAKVIQQLAQQYPEFVDAAAQILQLLQQGMTKIAGNGQRTPARPAPPVG
jgi:hypothetical protein